MAKERDVADQPTCGQGLAHNASVPANLAKVAARLAGNLDVHMTALDRDDPAAAQEHAVYANVAGHLRAGAGELEAAAAAMAAARDLPMGRHDMAVMTSPAVLEAFERYVAAEDDLRALLEARRAPNAQMLGMIKGAVEARG
jgi:hypothetical protein